MGDCQLHCCKLAIWVVQSPSNEMIVVLNLELQNLTDTSKMTFPSIKATFDQDQAVQIPCWISEHT